MKATKEVIRAFNHVKEHYPQVVGVAFSTQGMWFYYDESFSGPTFNQNIDVNILNDALDSLKNLPFIYEP